MRMSLLYQPGASLLPIQDPSCKKANAGAGCLCVLSPRCHGRGEESINEMSSLRTKYMANENICLRLYNKQHTTKVIRVFSPTIHSEIPEMHSVLYQLLSSCWSPLTAQPPGRTCLPPACAERGLPALPPGPAGPARSAVFFRGKEQS